MKILKYSLSSKGLRAARSIYTTSTLHFDLQYKHINQEIYRIHSVLVSELLHLYFTPCYESSSHYWIINLSLHLHIPPSPALSLPVLSRRLNDNEISSLDTMGAFKKLPNLRKMYAPVHFSIFTLRAGVVGGWACHLGHLAVSFLSITLCVMSHVGGVDRGSSRILGWNGRRRSGIYCLAIFATHSEDGKSSGLSERRPVIYQAWNCLCYSAVELITNGSHLKVPLLMFYWSTDCNQLVNH